MPARGLVFVVVAHWLAAGVHGAAHAAIPVPLPFAKDAFIAIAVVVLPLAGLLTLRRRPRLGGVLILTGLSGALVFGVLHHFLWSGPDHVSGIGGSWGPAFRWSAVLLAVTEAIGVGLALRGIRYPASRPRL